MSMTDLAKSLPDYAKDLRLNMGSLLNETVMTDQQKYGTLLASAIAAGHLPTIAAAEAEAGAKMSPEAVNAAKAAAAVMAMNNVYYRFGHLASNKEYSKMPAKLRMNVIGAPGIDKADFELYSLAVSAINGCGLCVDAHEKVLAQHGVKAEVVQAAVRLGSVTVAVAHTLRAIA